MFFSHNLQVGLSGEALAVWELAFSAFAKWQQRAHPAQAGPVMSAGHSHELQLASVTAQHVLHAQFSEGTGTSIAGICDLIAARTSLATSSNW